MNRSSQVSHAGDEVYDLVVVGGGATGLGIALDAAKRGYNCLLLEQFDFAKGTSSKATKLVHGGVRYLAQGNIALVREALFERGYMLKNAAHLCQIQPFVIPCYSWFDYFYYGIGLKIYDWLSFKLSLGKTKWLSSKRVIQAMPEVNSIGLKGGVQYFDGQFDDSRFCVSLAQTALQLGAKVLNYCKVTTLVKNNTGKIVGLKFLDTISQKEVEVKANLVVNATGVFVDELMQKDNPSAPTKVTPSQGLHLVIKKAFFSSAEALMIPKTTDGRVLFAVPWHNHVVVGTTDNAVKEIEIEPKPIDQEIDFVLQNLNQYLNIAVTRNMVDSVFVGLRPLVKQEGQSSTAKLNREHSIFVSESGLMSITGGKWTTYRAMAKDLLTQAIKLKKLKEVKCSTEQLELIYSSPKRKNDGLDFYGSARELIEKIIEESPANSELLHPSFPYPKACVILAVRNELAQTIEDVLARRIRLLFLDAKAALQCAPIVVEIMTKELGHNEEWGKAQIESFSKLALQYQLNN